MFVVEQGNVDSALQEMAQDGYELIGTVMLLSAVIGCSETLSQQYNPQMQALTLVRLLDMLESNIKELSSLATTVRKQLPSVGESVV